MARPKAGTQVSVPPDFAEMLVRLFAPGEVDECAAALEQALRLDDARLATFLEQLADRIRYSVEPLTAAELAELIELTTRESLGAAIPPPPA